MSDEQIAAVVGFKISDVRKWLDSGNTIIQHKTM